MPGPTAAGTLGMPINTMKGAGMSNQELESAVTEELAYDPKVDAASVAVQADDGTVTLRGTVGSFFEKRAAQKAAENVWGVVKVDNKLNVHLLVGGGRDDAELRADVLSALMLDAMVPSSIDASVVDGVVTLTGEAQQGFQRDEALRVAGNVLGVKDVWTQVLVTGPPPDTHDVQKSIKKAFKRNAKLDAKNVEVTSSNGTVTLAGTVSSWSEHDEAVEVAWAAPGVHDVDDELRVAY
jgi:osmotically-inducible protein OsmY